MRLLLTTDTVGGVWDYTATLTRQLVARGHSTYLAVIGHPSDEQIATLPEEVVIESYEHRLEWMRATETELTTTAEWLARMARLWKVDVVHLNQMAYSGLVDFDVPVVVVVHSDTCSWFQEVLGEPLPEEWLEYKRLVRQGLEAADVLVAPTRYQAEMTERCVGPRIDVVIHNGIEPPSGAAAEARGRPPLLLEAGRAWDEAKAMGLFDQAVSRLGSDAPPAFIVGSVESPTSGERFEACCVTCVGRVAADEVSEWMSRATIYVGTSIYEPFGLAPLEAAMHGCALVLSDIGSFQEIWDGSAVFFPRNDVEALAETLQGLVSDPERVYQLGQKARERAVAHFSASRFADDYLKLYSTMISG
jgi:glycogen synthase